MRKKASSPVGLGFLTLTIAACAASGSATFGGATAGSAAGGGSGSQSGTLGVLPTSGSVVGNNGGLSVPEGSTSNSSPDSSITDAFVKCAGTTVQAKQLPLDVFMLLDQSFSMDDLVSAGRSKWGAVTAAINAFATDPASAGINVGLQFFPKVAAGFPASCTASAQCGATGLCGSKACANPNIPLTVCNTDTDCIACAGRRCQAFACVPLGWCSLEKNLPCDTPGMACGPDANGIDAGTCVVPPSSTCLGADDCVATDYQTLAVPLAPLPNNAMPIATALAAHGPGPGYQTPTEAGLQGVIAAAKAYAVAHPSDTVVVVLATDGQPDEAADPTNQCVVPQTIQMANGQVTTIATAGFNGAPSIKTFAIGVFAPADVASGTATLDQLAMAGGTGTPFIIATATAAANTGQQFSAALAAIRGTSLPCDYQVPVPATGTPNFFEINVVWTSAAGVATTLPYVHSADRCDPTQGGWYYNVDPSEGGVPNTILMCGTSCSALKSGSGRVDIQLGCTTQMLLPR